MLAEMSVKNDAVAVSKINILICYMPESTQSCYGWVVN